MLELMLCMIMICQIVRTILAISQASAIEGVAEELRLSRKSDDKPVMPTNPY